MKGILRELLQRYDEYSFHFHTGVLPLGLFLAWSKSNLVHMEFRLLEQSRVPKIVYAVLKMLKWQQIYSIMDSLQSKVIKSKRF